MVDPERVENVTKLALAFVENLRTGKHAEANKTFSPIMAKAMPANQLADVWPELEKAFGKMEKVVRTTHEVKGKYDIVYVTCKFEKGSRDLKVVYDKDDKVSGLFVVESRPTEPWKSAAYAKPDAFEEKDVTVGKAPWELPGTLSLPKGAKKAPALVLVHGSGPNDRDETVGASKPFRDLAEGLASRGIAVLRYEKRTKQHGAAMTKEQIAELTVAEETVEDAVAAAALLRSTEGVDPDRVFVLGHSLGGTAIPRIAQADDKTRGFVILAGSTRPLEDIVLDQVRYISNVDGALNEMEKANIAALEKQVERAKKLEEGQDVPAKDLPLGVSAKYLLDLRAHPPADEIVAEKRPLLVLQGERDYQVTMKDYALWKGALSSHADATLKSYPKLNHLFIAGEGKSTPAEYNKPGHVDEKVIADIAKWIEGH